MTDGSGNAEQRGLACAPPVGETVLGSIVVYRPQGRDRLSDYAAIDERFRYLELPDRTVLINSAHIVALTEVTE